MNRKDFELIVQETLDALPAEFRYALENVAVVVDDEPDDARDRDSLLGLYEGTSLLDQGAGSIDLPARIRIFRGPILRSFRTRARIAAEIRDTVIHELGHHMGLEEDEMPY